jgi:hypothetical protein
LSETEFSNVLDLSGADTSGFDPVDAGRYDAVVWDAEWKRTKPDSNGAYGPNWPYISVQFKVDGRIAGVSVGDRRIFTNYFPTAPQGYDPKKAAKSSGSFVNFLVGLGFKEEDVKKADFSIDFEAWKNKPCVIAVTVDTEFNTNKVAGVKPAGTSVAAQSSSGLL